MIHPRLASLLQQRETQLRAILEAGSTQPSLAQPSQAEVADFKELAANETFHAMEDIKVEHAAAELAQVLAARRRITMGTYGTCADCGEPIEEQRLLAMPAALYCKDCQALRERSIAARQALSSTSRQDMP